MKTQPKKELTYDDLMWNLAMYLLKKQSFPADPYFAQHRQSLQKDIKESRGFNVKYVEVTQKIDDLSRDSRSK
jgi:hypothetical protein